MTLFVVVIVVTAFLLLENLSKRSTPGHVVEVTPSERGNDRELMANRQDGSLAEGVWAFENDIWWAFPTPSEDAREQVERRVGVMKDYFDDNGECITGQLMDKRGMETYSRCEKNWCAWVQIWSHNLFEETIDFTWTKTRAFLRTGSLNTDKHWKYCARKVGSELGPHQQVYLAESQRCGNIVHSSLCTIRILNDDGVYYTIIKNEVNDLRAVQNICYSLIRDVCAPNTEGLYDLGHADSPDYDDPAFYNGEQAFELYYVGDQEGTVYWTWSMDSEPIEVNFWPHN